MRDYYPFLQDITKPLLKDIPYDWGHIVVSCGTNTEFFKVLLSVLYLYKKIRISQHIKISSWYDIDIRFRKNSKDATIHTSNIDLEPLIKSICNIYQPLLENGVNSKYYRIMIPIYDVDFIFITARERISVSQWVKEIFIKRNIPLRYLDSLKIIGYDD